VYRALPRFRPVGPAKLSTWILAIAARTALKSRRGDRDHVELDDIPQPPAQLARVAQRSFVDALAYALDALPAPFRAVFVLHAYHELDHAEIAAALDIEPGTVKSRLSRAREQLRAQLKEFAP
jgi:RNA polymerase sigma-70 factor (ECF subfamily)